MGFPGSYTKSQLYAEITDTLDDSSPSTAQLDRLVAKARSEIQLAYNFKWLEASQDYTFVGGETFIAEPTNFKQFKSLRLLDSSTFGYVSKLTYLPRHLFEQLKAEDTLAGDLDEQVQDALTLLEVGPDDAARGYSHFNGQVDLYPTMDRTDLILRVSYYQFLPASLAAEGDNYTDAVMNAQSGALVHAVACSKAAAFLKDYDALRYWQDEATKLLTQEITLAVSQRDRAEGEQAEDRMGDGG